MTDARSYPAEGAADPCLDPRFRSPRLNPCDAAAYLAKVHGTPLAPATLAKLRCVGGGPEFNRFGRSIYYTRDDLDAWTAQRLSGNLRSTSDACPR